MRKLLTAIACFVALSLPVYVQGFDFKPYIGFDLQRISYNYGDLDVGDGLMADGGAIFEDSFYGLNIHIGNRFYKYFALELGYFMTEEKSKNVASGSRVGLNAQATVDLSTDIKFYGVTLDGLSYLPLGEQERFELIGIAGLTWNKAEFKINVPTDLASDTGEEINFHLGAGAQYSFMEKMNLRGLIRYQTADFDGDIDYALTYSIGLNYQF